MRETPTEECVCWKMTVECSTLKSGLLCISNVNYEIWVCQYNSASLENSSWLFNFAFFTHEVVLLRSVTLSLLSRCHPFGFPSLWHRDTMFYTLLLVQEGRKFHNCIEKYESQFK